MRSNIFGVQKRSYAYNSLSVGSVIRGALSENGNNGNVLEWTLLDKRNERDREEINLAIYAFVKAGKDDVWAVVSRMVRHDLCYKAECRGPSVVRLDHRMLRVAAIHNCDEQSSFNHRLGTVKHGSSVTNGGLYWLFCRREGYPPHMG